MGADKVKGVPGQAQGSLDLPLLTLDLEQEDGFVSLPGLPCLRLDGPKRRFEYPYDEVTDIRLSCKEFEVGLLQSLEKASPAEDGQ